MRHIILILAVFIGSQLTGKTYAQTSADDQRIAYSYYNNKEYDKAAYMFETIFNQTKSKTHFHYYITCLIKNGDLDKAEKAARKQLSASKNNSTYRVILGNVYKARHQNDKAEQEYKEALEGMRPDRNSIIELTNQLLTSEERDLAEKALIRGQEISGQDLSMELFSVYASNRNFKMMSETALNIIEKDPTRIYTVQNQMQYYLNNDINDEFYNILRTATVQRIQQNPLKQ